MQTAEIKHTLDLSVLPINVQQELIDYYQFLIEKYTSKNLDNKSAGKILTPVKERIFGQHRGLCEMSEDFDDELPDSFWLGE